PASDRPEDLRGAVTEDGRVELLFFGSSTCGYCRQMASFLDELETRYAPPLEVHRYTVNVDPLAAQRWEEELLSRGQAPQGVPTTIIGDRIWVGYNTDVGTEIAGVVDGLVAVVEAEASTDVGPELVPGNGGASIEIPLVGEVALADRSAIGVTALIALVDGFNPCSLWVMAVLLAMILNAGATRSRTFAIGGTFLLVTASLYGLFILGIFTVVDLLSSLTAITVVVGLVAVVFGAVNIKDYFAYKQGLSFTIPDRFKPRIYRGGRALRDHRRPLLPILGTTVVLAAGVAIVELPCTVGFPVVWTGTLQSRGIERGPEFFGLLALYLLIYLLDELLLFGAVVVTMEVTRVEEKHGRALKLIGGSLMAVLGIAMIAAPTLLEDLGGLLLVTASAVALMGVLALIERTRPKRRDTTADAEPTEPSTPGGGDMRSG
ncbi:MAG: thioredoxin family protein, partial [Acidimicrobiia bacterium]